MRTLILIVVLCVSTWLSIVALLGVLRPRGMDLQAANAFIPDVIRLLRHLAADPDTGRGVRIRLGVLLIYLASPIDLVPDFIPVIGLADDVIVLSLILRAVIRRAGSDSLDRHWSGSADGLALVRRLAGLDYPTNRRAGETDPPPTRSA